MEEDVWYRMKFRVDIESEPPAAVASTTSQGGSFQTARAASAASASARSAGCRMALVQTGS